MIYGAFKNREVFIRAVESLRTRGEVCELYLPFEIEDVLDEKQPSRIPAIGLVGATLGLIGGFMMQVYASVYDTPLWVGGRPLFSWPAFIPVTFVLTVLCTALFVFVGWMIICRLPWLHHEAFNHVDLTQHEFWIASNGPEAAQRFKELGAHRVREDLR